MTQKMFGYESVYNYIHKLIDTILQEHDKLPSENEICKKFDITRSTARQGIARLKNEGVIYAKKGSGYFVSPQPILYELSPYTTFTTQIKKAGKTPSLKILRSEIIKDQKIALKLNINSCDEILAVDFIRYVDKTPFLVTKSYLNINKLPNIQNYIKDIDSLTNLFKSKYNIEPIREHSELEIIPNHIELEDILMTGNNLPLIKISSTSIDKIDETIIEYCESYFRSDMAKIVINYNGEQK